MDKMDRITATALGPAFGCGLWAGGRYCDRQAFILPILSILSKLLFLILCLPKPDCREDGTIGGLGG